MEKDSVTTVCYLGVFILIILIFVPPFFRFLDSPTKIPVSDLDIKYLKCRKTEKLEGDVQVTVAVKNEYIDEKLNSIIFTFSVINPSNIDESILLSKSEVLNERDILRKDNTAIIKENDIKISINKNSNISTTLSKYTGNFSEQKTSNINYGYSCE